MAELIGYEQSYVSALETGAKGIPKIAFLNCVLSLKEPPITVSKQPLSTSQKSHQ